MTKKDTMSGMMAIGIITIISVLLVPKDLSAFSGCDSVNVPLTQKFRFLGSYGRYGQPEYLDPNSDTLSPDLVDFVNKVLPERRNLPKYDGSLFTDHLQLNTELKDKSKVYLTFVSEGATWRNTLGFYTYDVNNPPQTVYDIDSLTIIFPNVTDPGVVSPGDKVFLGEFPANTGIGYFLIANGWVGDTVCIPSHIVFTDRQLNTFTSEAYQQQTVLLNYQSQNRMLLGFEDQKRPSGDNDFNDAVFYITTSSPGAIDTTNIPEIPVATISGDTTLCSGDGIATVQVDLTGKAPWNLVYNDGEKNVTVNDIAASPYIFTTSIGATYTLVSVSDKYTKGFAEGSVTIAQGNVSAMLSGVAKLCGNEDTDTLQVILQGSAPWNFKYSDGTTEKSVTTDLSTYPLEISKAGNYELIEVSDAHCPGTVSGQVDVMTHDLPTATISGEDAICSKDSSAIVNVQLNGSKPFSFTYSIDNQETTVKTDQSGYSLQVLHPGIYSLVSVSDAYCVGTVEGQANIHDKVDDLQADITSDDKSCNGDPVNITIVSDIPQESMHFTTSGKGTLEKTSGLEYTYIPAAGETGMVMLNLDVSNACGAKTFSKEITIGPDLDANFNVNPSELYTQSDITFIPVDSELDSYQWDFGDNSNGNATMPVHQYDKGGKYTVGLTVDKDGCSAEDSVEIEVLAKEVLYVPNAFSPYNDNPENRVVKVYGNNVSNEGFFFRIVNRWGKTMYETKSFTEANTVGWDGVNNNTDEKQELNVFSYVLRGKFTEGDSFEKTGTVTLVK